MDKRKKSFSVSYKNAEMLIRNFSIEEIGQIFRAICMHEIHGALTEFEDRAMQMAYKDFMRDCDNEMKRYKHRCDVNKRNRNKHKYE